MIEAKDLRVGNLVYNFLDKPIEVTWENIKWSQDVFPIPLAAKILVNSKFLKDGDYEIYRIKDFGVGLNEPYGWQPIYSSRVIGEPIKNLHQLQNLYSALELKELDIKL